ncbi:hypothetical protein [Micromonospora costi]|uniref:hypothetical protein n=1 Tax=Micromonospora costi TaxID=1530042 RepID=UPI001F4DF65F|nr:hypothetical protein [Micromonospora costi]
MNFRRSGRPADRDETDQLLDAARAGTPTGPDADPANPLAELLGAAAAPTRPHELAGEQAALAAFRAARAAASATSTRAPRRRRFTAGAVAWAAAALATATAGAAFAAVNLDRPPDFVPPPGPETSSPIKDGPDSSPTGGNTTSSPGSSPTAAPSPGTTGPTASPEQTTQLSELCRVYLAAKPAQREEALQTRRFAPLVAAAGGAGKVKGYCQRIARETGPRGENEPGAGNGPGTGKGSDAGKKPEATAKPSRPVREQPSHPAAGGRPTDAAGNPPTAGRLLVRRAVGLGILDQEDEQPYIDIRLGRRPIEPAAARLGITVDALCMRLGRIDTRLADALAAGLLTGVTSQQAADEPAHQAGHRLATRTGRASARGVTPFLAGMATLTRSPDATWSPGSLVRGWPSVSLGPLRRC